MRHRPVSGRLATCLALTVFAATACDEETTVLLPVGAACDNPTDQCDSGLCLTMPFAVRNPVFPDARYRICSIYCSDLYPCQDGMVCIAVEPDPTLVCVPGCSTDSDVSPTSSGVCEGGAPTACTAATYGAHCSGCGCRDEDWCQESGDVQSCIPKSDVGAACERNAQCLSVNCGVPASGGDRRCLVPIGAPCTSDNCGRCMAGGAYCSKTCTMSSDCGSGNRCSGTADSGYYCHKDCTNGVCHDGYGCSPNPSVCPVGQTCQRVIERIYDYPYEQTAFYDCA